MTPTPRTDAIEVFQAGMECGGVNLPFARTLERENAELLEALKLLTSHGHADDCLLINRSGESCDCGLDYAHVVIAKAKGVQP